jgi:4-diphosphocytidyl-2-C-methyl-D-erythritol kinase
VAVARTERAPAKVNLVLRVVGRRADGYHNIESLVVFSGVGDTVTFLPAPKLSLAVRGPTAAASGALADNLVLKAAYALAERIAGLRLGHFVLSKRIPVAAGLGGGSADAAAALRLIARANRIALDDKRLMEAARATGADVPVCLDPGPRLMRGIGDILSEPLMLPRLPSVLVNPRIAVSTRDVFAAYHRAREDHPQRGVQLSAEGWARADFVQALRESGNDLEAPAIAIEPAIDAVLSALRFLPACRLARMSGSGATCFGLFDSVKAATLAARALRVRHPGWWIRATVLG